MVSREEAHAYLKETFAFSEYYGKNLDALHDCLAEMEEMEVEFLHVGTMLAGLDGYGEKLLQVFAKTETVKRYVEIEE